MHDEEDLGGGLAQRAQDLHLAAALAAKPDPRELAAWLFEQETESQYVDREASEQRYAAALGESGLAEFRRLAESAWAAIPPRQPQRPQRRGAPVPVEIDHSGERVRAVLDRFAEAGDDLDARIALLAKDLSSPGRYLNLAEFCLRHGRAEEALARAEEAVWLFDDGVPDERLLCFWAKRLVEAGRGADAVQRLAKAFAAAPSRRLYDALAAAGGQDASIAARAKLAALLPARQPAGAPGPGPVTGQPWQVSGNATLLVEILLEEGDLVGAWRVAAEQPLHGKVTERLLEASAQDFPAEALALLARRVDEAIGRSAYEEAVQHIARMKPLRQPADHRAYIAQLRDRHARKRKLLALLS